MALFLASGVPAVASAGDVLLHAGLILDVRTGAYLEDRAVLISAGRIAAIEPWPGARTASLGSEVVDLTAFTVLPGLVDAHTHLLSRRRPGEDYAAMLVTRSLPYRTLEGAANAIAGGADSIEHGFLMTPELLKTMAARGVAWVPTCQALFDWVEAAPQRAEVPQAQLDGLRKTIPAARRLGIRIAAGSDASSVEDHGRNARELVALTRLGLTPLEAVRAATVDGAAVLGLEDQIGAVEVGKRADLIAVRGDPLKEIGVLEQVAFVMKDGQVVRAP